MKLSTGIMYRGAMGARLKPGGAIVAWLGWNCFTGNNLEEVQSEIDSYLEGKDGNTGV